MNPSVALPARRASLPWSARAFIALMSRIRVGTMVLTLPDGEVRQFTATASPHVELTVYHWRSFRRILQSGDIGFAEAYRDGDLSCNDIVAALTLAICNSDVMEQTLHGTFWGTLLYRLQHLGNRNSRRGSKKNIHAHYDIGNRFYRLWLDAGMTYSAGIFEHDGVTLADAQQAKYERILKMVNPEPGDRILEIGCGWGAFAEYAAKTRGCHVHGISLSREQLDHARQRVRGTPVESLVKFEFRDYRDISGQYDAIVSIEMFEAVGEEYWPSFFSMLERSVKPDGLIALQSITIGDEHFASYRSKTDFIQQYIFPGGMLPSPNRLQELARDAGLLMLDQFEFGGDYARTLRRWRGAFLEHADEIRAQGFDEKFMKLWNFYLCYCEAGFDTGRTGVRQVLMQRLPA